MAPTTTPGVNPAPLYKEKTNAIAALMSRHTSSPSLSFLSSLPSRNPGSAAPPKTAAQLAAQAEDYELDRIAQYDDNMGVGMFAPENRKEKEEKRRKELEDRRLKARLGIGSKRKGSEWEGVSGVARAREQESDDDEEMGRSGVGRAKKRQRIVAREEKRPENKLSEDVEMAQVAVQEQPDTAPNEKIEDNEEVAEAQGDDSQEPSSSKTLALAADQSNPEAEAKKKRKKKKKNKSKSQTAGAVGS